MLNLIDGLEQALRDEISTGGDMYVSGQQAADINETNPSLVMSREEGGKAVHTVITAVRSIGRLEALLEMAVKHDRNICVG